MSNTYEKFRNEIVAGGGIDVPDETVRGLRAFVGVGSMIALLALLAVVNIWIFVFVVGMLVSVFLHEMGHFVTARRSGMKVTQFFMGMGPRLWSFKRNDIEYGVRALPIGAFVRIVGMNNLDETPPEDEPHTYRSKSYPKRMLVITAGSMMHMIIAVVLLFGVYNVWGKNRATGEVTFVKVEANGPAAKAGLQPDDIIETAGGVVVTRASQFVDLVHQRHPGDVAELGVRRNGKQLTVDVALGTNPNVGSEGLAYLGVVSADKSAFQNISFAEATTSSFTDLWSAAWQSVKGVGKVMNPVNIFSHLSGTNKDQSTQPVTVYGISRLSSTIGRETGLPGILLTLAGINVFIGLLNLFPLLPFDGGHAAIATYERIRTRRGHRYTADVAKMVPVAMTVMTFLVFVLFAGLYLDITNPIR
jgi:membrane-associated protease RseP (regulator of RpoE activity)